jgi:trimeric autotransporter adhesin
MSLILDGSNGLSDVDGSAATPAIRGTDTNTGIFFPAADTIAFSEGGAESMRIDSLGNLLVGTTTSSAPLAIGKAAVTAATGQLGLFSPTAFDSNISGISITKFANDSTTAQVLIRFLMNQGGTGQGQINANGANTAAFGSYSDRRLKENIEDLPSQLENIMALRPVEFDYLESMGGGHQIGFIAQEVNEIYPDLVSEDENGMLTLTDMNKNDARLIKAIQELKAELDTVKAELATLKA